MSQSFASSSSGVTIADEIESSLRGSPAIAEIRRAGLGVEVRSDGDGYVAELIDPRARGFPVLQARVGRAELTQRSASEPAAYIAGRLATELSRGWNLWVGEGAA